MSSKQQNFEQEPTILDVNNSRKDVRSAITGFFVVGGGKIVWHEDPRHSGLDEWRRCCTPIRFFPSPLLLSHVNLGKVLYGQLNRAHVLGEVAGLLNNLA